MYCVKCKRITGSKDLERVVSRKNRNMLRGKCEVCGVTKTQFVRGAPLPTPLEYPMQGPTPRGQGLTNKLINNLPFEAHLPGHNFTGPGTKLNRRLNEDLTPKPWSKPINRVDEAAYRHDICYATHKDTKSRNSICDKNMLTELKGIYNPTLREKLDKSLVEKIIGTKARFGWGLKKT